MKPITVITLTVLAILVTGIVAPPAQAEAATECPSYLEQVVSPVDFDFLAAKVSKLPSKKDEFESTAQFESRLADALNGQPETYIVGIPFGTEFVTYDADAQRLRIKESAFDPITVTLWDSLFGLGKPLHGQVKYSRALSNIDVVISKATISAGSYPASNALGAETEVYKKRQTTKAIFDREGEYNETLFFPPPPPLTYVRPDVVVDFEATPELARKFKTKYRAALVIAPKAPFYATGKVRHSQPTIQHPWKYDETLFAIIADIRCVLLTDETRKVAVTITTR